MYVENTRARGESSLPRVFAKRAGVRVQGSDSRTTWRNYATNWSPPSRSSPPPPRSSSVYLLVALERPRLVSLTLKPLKRSHSRPCSLRRACRSKITFETRAHGLLTLLRGEDNSVRLGLKEGLFPARGISLDSLLWNVQQFKTGKF